MFATLTLSLAVLSSIVWTTEARASQALAQRNGCVACHQPDAKVLGPSWKEISQKYGDGKATVEQLSASIKFGSTGKWGAMPMPPQAQVSDADLKTLSQWLLDGAKQ